MTLDFTSAASPAGQRSPAARRYTKIKEDDRYIVIGIVFWVIWIADFNNAIRFYAHRPARRPRVTRRSMVTRRPPPHQNSKKMTNISLWVSILGLFGPLISIMTLDFTSADPPEPAKDYPPPADTPKFKEDDKYIVMGIDFGVIWPADFDNTIRFYLRRPVRRPTVTRHPPLHKNQRR